MNNQNLKQFLQTCHELGSRLSLLYSEIAENPEIKPPTRRLFAAMHLETSLYFEQLDLKKLFVVISSENGLRLPNWKNSSCLRRPLQPSTGRW